jgi:hypothetical protein
LPKKASNSLRNACPICAQRIELAGFVFLQAVGVDEEIKGAFGFCFLESEEASGSAELVVQA